VLPANEHVLAFRVSARVYAPPAVPLGMKLSLCVLFKVPPPVVRIMCRQCIIIQVTKHEFSRRPSGPSPSQTDAATATRLQVETLCANLSLTVYPTKDALIGMLIHPALPPVCPKPRRRLLRTFREKLPNTPSVTALPQLF